MAFDIEETIELIDMHGRTIVGDSCCDDCGLPMRHKMLAKLDRMRELILSLPEHVDSEDDVENRERLQ